MPLIDDFHVHRFRGLNDAAIEGAGGVNLVVGGNNSGKTSLLEALAVFATPLDVVAWAATARLREIRSSVLTGTASLSTDEAVGWLFPLDGEDGDIRVERHLALSGTGHAPVREVSARYTPIRGYPPPNRFETSRTKVLDLSEEEGWHLSIEVESDGRSVTPVEPRQLDLDVFLGSIGSRTTLEADLWPSRGLRSAVKRVGPRIPCVMLSPYSHRNQPLQLSQLSNAIRSGEKNGLIDLLHGIDPHLRDLEIVTDPSGRPFLTAVMERGRRFPVTVLGDGFRRALAIAVAINQARGGLLLIDEIETALHVGALDTLYPWLIHAARARDVQVFATTHSLEAIQAITNAASTLGDDGLTAFHLFGRDEAATRIKRYSAAMLSRLVGERGLDIR